jgi:hypothetical protein
MGLPQRIARLLEKFGGTANHSANFPLFDCNHRLSQILLLILSNSVGVDVNNRFWQASWDSANGVSGPLVPRLIIGLPLKRGINHIFPVFLKSLAGGQPTPVTLVKTGATFRL